MLKCGQRCLAPPNNTSLLQCWLGSLMIKYELELRLALATGLLLIECGRLGTQVQLSDTVFARAHSLWVTILRDPNKEVWAKFTDSYATFTAVLLALEHWKLNVALETVFYLFRWLYGSIWCLKTGNPLVKGTQATNFCLQQFWAHFLGHTQWDWFESVLLLGVLNLDRQWQRA
jgi:hypothetical protein